ncbi:MAG: hypothetical protein ABFD08_03655 [Syntrophomonas sp.]
MSDNMELIKGLSSEDERERAFAVEDIVFEGIPGAIDLLVEHLKVEKSRFVREVVINNLKTIPGQELIEKLIPLLRSDDAFIRNSIIDIISEQDELAVSLLKPLIKDSDKDVRKFAIDILFQLKSYHSMELIAETLDDPDINMLITAVEYLGRLEARNFASNINQLFMKTNSILLRCTCLEALAVIGNKESIEVVAERYSDHNSIGDLELYSFLKFLAGQGNESHLPFAVSLIKSKGKLMAKEIINAVERVLERAKIEYLPPGIVEELAYFINSDINDINKYELLLLLGQFKNSEIESLLLTFLDSQDKLPRLGAIEALGLFGSKKGLVILDGLRIKEEDEDILEAIEKSINQLGG